MNSQINQNIMTDNRRLNEVQQKINKIIETDISYNLEGLYLEIKNKKDINGNSVLPYVEKLLMEKDPTKSGKISHSDFSQIIDQYLTLPIQKKNVLVSDLVCAENSGLINYNKFLTSIRSSSPANLRSIYLSISIKNNDLLLLYSNSLSNEPLRNIWSQKFNRNPKITKNDFISLLNMLTQSEAEWIFGLIEDNGFISFKKFNRAIESAKGNQNIQINNSSQNPFSFRNEINPIPSEAIPNNENIINNNINMPISNQDNFLQFVQSGIYDENNKNINTNNINNNNNFNNINTNTNNFNGNFNNPNNNNINTNNFQSINNKPSTNINTQFTQSLNPNQIPYESHPVIFYSSEEKRNEIQNASAQEQYMIIQSRFSSIKSKISSILRNHERYTLTIILLKILASLQARRGEDPMTAFIIRDPKRSGMLPISMINEGLIYLGVTLEPKDLKLLLESLLRKVGNLYGYDEIIKKALAAQYDGYNSILKTFAECNLEFNDYLVDLRKHLKDKGLEFEKVYAKACNNIELITFEEFQKFLTEIDFRLGHLEEVRYLFSNLVPENYGNSGVTVDTNRPLRFQVLQTFFTKPEESEATFLEKGKVLREKVKKGEWAKNITKYAEGAKEMVKENYKTYIASFRAIQNACQKCGVKDIVKFFEDSGEVITEEGDMEVTKFVDLMKSMGVPQSLYFEQMIFQFKYSTGPKKGIFFSLVKFLSIYLLFEEEEKKNNKK